MIRATAIVLVLAPLVAAATTPILDIAALSNQITRVTSENGQAGQQALNANTLLVIDQALCKTLGRTGPTADASSPAALQKEHQTLVAAYVQDIRQKIASTRTWPAGQTPAVWTNAATRLLDQAVAYHRDALADNGDLTSSLRLMNQVRAWTLGERELPAADSWTDTIDAQADAITGKTAAPAVAGNTKAPNEPVSVPSAATPTAPATPTPAEPLPTPVPAAAAAPASPAPALTAPAAGAPASPQPIALTWISKTRANGRLAVRHNLSTTNKAAWIGFFKQGASDRDYLSYTFLNNLTDRLYDVPPPEEAGSYQFRIYPDEGFTPAAVSTPVQVR